MPGSPACTACGGPTRAEGSAQSGEELALLRLWRELGEEEQTAAMRRLTAIRKKQG